MNTLSYIYSSILKKFGIYDNKKWLGNANKNTYYLKEAQEILGEDAWKDIESIHELKGTFTLIYELVEKQIKLENEISKIKEYGDQQENKHQSLNNLNVKIKLLEQEKKPYFKNIGMYLTNPKNSKDITCKNILKKHNQLYKKILSFRKNIKKSINLVNE